MLLKFLKNFHYANNDTEVRSTITINNQSINHLFLQDTAYRYT